MKRKVIIWIVGLVSVGFIACVLAEICLTEGIRSIIFETATVYADGYSDSRWLSVRTGMMTGEVYRILGKPIWVGNCAGLGHPEQIGWGYTGKSATESPRYRQRLVIFAHDKVVEKVAGVAGGR